MFLGMMEPHVTPACGSDAGRSMSSMRENSHGVAGQGGGSIDLLCATVTQCDRVCVSVCLCVCVYKTQRLCHRKGCRAPCLTPAVPLCPSAGAYFIKSRRRHTVCLPSLRPSPPSLPPPLPPLPSPTSFDPSLTPPPSFSISYSVRPTHTPRTKQSLKGQADAVC